MTTETMRNVLAEPVEIRGGCPREPRHDRFPLNSRDDGYFSGAGYSIGLVVADSGVTRVELRKHGPDTALLGADFDHEDEAQAEFDRLKALVLLKEQVLSVVSLLHDRLDVLPYSFLANVKAGEFETLAVAADYQDEQGEADKAMLLRSAYYRLTGQANVAVKVNKKTTIVYNPEEVTKRRPAGGFGSAGIGNLTAAVVTVGESVRIVAINTNTFRAVAVEVKEYRVGDQAEYGSYNLVYYGPVTTITAKTVTVVEKGYSPERAPKHRLTLAQFVEKNRDFDLAKAQKRNAEYMD